MGGNKIQFTPGLKMRIIFDNNYKFKKFHQEIKPNSCEPQFLSGFRVVMLPIFLP
jgi:hypothetical protein